MGHVVRGWVPPDLLSPENKSRVATVMRRGGRVVGQLEGPLCFSISRHYSFPPLPYIQCFTSFERNPCTFMMFSYTHRTPRAIISLDGHTPDTASFFITDRMTHPHPSRFYRRGAWSSAVRGVAQGYPVSRSRARDSQPESACFSRCPGRPAWATGSEHRDTG